MRQLGPLQRSARVGCVLFALLGALGACTSQREPAQRMMQDIEATLGAVADDATQYVPGELVDVQTKLDDLKTAYAAHDYRTVLARGPALLGEAHGLAADAAAQRTQIAQSRTQEWSSLAAAVPALFTAVQRRLDLLDQAKNRKVAAGIDLDAARSALREAASQWSKAQGAFGNGNMNEAVPTAHDVESRLRTLAGTLQAQLPEGLAPPPTS